VGEQKGPRNPKKRAQGIADAKTREPKVYVVGPNPVETCFMGGEGRGLRGPGPNSLRQQSQEKKTTGRRDRLWGKNDEGDTCKINNTEKKNGWQSFERRKKKKKKGDAASGNGEASRPAKGGALEEKPKGG